MAQVEGWQQRLGLIANFSQAGNIIHAMKGKHRIANYACGERYGYAAAFVGLD